MKEPVWEARPYPVLGGPRYGGVLTSGRGFKVYSWDQYTRPWSARRGLRRFHARYLKGTIRERSK